MGALPRSGSVALSGPAGALEARCELPPGPARFAVVIGHPHPLHGGSMQTNMVVHAGRALLADGAVVLRFNFRGVGRSAGTHAGAAGAREDYRAALTAASARHADLPLVAAGCSFGALRAMECSADPGVVGCLAVVPPVTHPAHQPPPVAPGPTAVVLAERDELVPRPPAALVARVFPRLVGVEVVAGADHLFTGRLAAYREAVRAAVAPLVAS